jgi:hypothetical protein
VFNLAQMVVLNYMALHGDGADDLCKSEHRGGRRLDVP